MKTDIIKKVRKELKENIDEKTKLGFQRYFKEKVKAYGIKSGAVGKVADNNYKYLLKENLSKSEIFNLCEELFKSGYCEEAWVACSWSHKCSKDFKRSDFKTFIRWIDKYIDNWAECDTFCNHTMGDFIEMYPEYIQDLKKLTKSKNRWLKRASAVSLIVPAHNGKYLKDIFEISDSLLLDPDDMVQKGYGWLLKKASRMNQKAVFDYVVKNKKKMPRTALRYAIEKMPEHLRKQAMI